MSVANFAQLFNMPIFSVLFIVFSYLQPQGLEVAVNSVAAPIQNICTNLLSFPSKHLLLYKAIACGSSVKISSYEVLKTVSLWHLIIVSAGHFQVILWLLKYCKTPFIWFPHAVLVIFCLATGAQPPVVRAYIELLLKHTNQKEKLWIPAEYRTLYSSCFILLIFPSWVHSWSFLLSWLCGILILLLRKQNLFTQALGISLGVFPISCLFSSPHPLSFLFNIVFAPPLSLLLFPLCLLMIPFPFLNRIADPLVDGLLFLLEQLAGTTPLNQAKAIFSSSPTTFIIAWIYVLCLQSLVLLKTLYSNSRESKTSRNSEF